MKEYLLQHLFENTIEKYPDKIAVKYLETDISFQELYRKSTAIGAALKNEYNVKNNDRIGILLDKSINQVISLLGVLYADSIFVIISPILSISQINHILKNCGINTIITSDKLQKKLKLKTLHSEKKIQIINQEQFPEMFVAFEKKSPENKNIGSDISNIIYTSGSTGLPKGIVVTHQNLIEGAQIVSKYLKITENDKILGLPPFNFDYGLNQLTSVLYKGCSIILFQYFMPNSLLKILNDEKITGLPGLPAVWTSVFNKKMASFDNRYDFNNLRYISNTGGKLPVPIVKKIRKTFPNAELYLMYGLTEAFRSSYLNPKLVDKKPDSIGKAIPNVQIEVINERGEICKPAEIGELIHRGACITRGYWNDPKKTAKVFRSNPLLPNQAKFLEKVVYSGDLVKKDEKGYFYFIGRKDSMIKRSGYRISPTEIEELLIGFPAINDAVAFGEKDEKEGQRIHAVIKLKHEIQKRKIYEHCKANGPFYLVPTNISFVDNFPETASGKIDRAKVIMEFKKDDK